MAGGSASSGGPSVPWPADEAAPAAPLTGGSEGEGPGPADGGGELRRTCPPAMFTWLAEWPSDTTDSAPDLGNVGGPSCPTAKPVMAVGRAGPAGWGLPPAPGGPAPPSDPRAGVAREGTGGTRRETCGVTFAIAVCTGLSALCTGPAAPASVVGRGDPGPSTGPVTLLAAATAAPVPSCNEPGAELLAGPTVSVSAPTGLAMSWPTPGALEFSRGLAPAGRADITRAATATTAATASPTRIRPASSRFCFSAAGSVASAGSAIRPI